MSPPSWRLVAPVNYKGSANKIGGLPGRVGRQVSVITDISTRSPHRFPRCRTQSPNSKCCWGCACGNPNASGASSVLRACPQNEAARGGSSWRLPMCLTC